MGTTWTVDVAVEKVPAAITKSTAVGPLKTDSPE